MKTTETSVDGSRRQVLVAGLTLTLASLSINALADSRPIKMIVPFGAGSSVDTVARMLAERLAFYLGTPVLIENRPGAGGGVGAMSAKQAAPDGTNLFMGTAGTHGINSALYKRLGYDPIKDFDPVIGITSSSNVVVTSPKLGIKNLADLVERAKASPGVLTMGSNGNGTTGHLAGVMLNRAAGIETVHVPYKDASIIDVIAGRLSYSFESVPLAIPYIKSGQVKALAVTNAQRESTLKEIPTIAELGYPDYQVMAWTAIFAPRGTPNDFILRVNAAANKALAEPDVIRRFAELGSTPIGGTSDDLRKRVAAELARWPEVVKAANVSLD